MLGRRFVEFADEIASIGFGSNSNAKVIGKVLNQTITYLTKALKDSRLALYAGIVGIIFRDMI
jgi:hypothetical protein